MKIREEGGGGKAEALARQISTSIYMRSMSKGKRNRRERNRREVKSRRTKKRIRWRRDKKGEY